MTDSDIATAAAAHLARSDEFNAAAEAARERGWLNAAAAQLGFAAVAARMALAVARPQPLVTAAEADALPGAVQPLIERLSQLRDVATLEPRSITPAELQEMRAIAAELRARAAAAVAGTAP